MLTFERVHEAFGHFLGALLAGGRGFWLAGPFADFAAHGRAHRVEQPAELAVNVQGADELGWEQNGALNEVGLKPDSDARADVGASRGLHLLVDQEKVAAAATIGEERGAEGEAGNLATDTTAVAHRPSFGDVEGDADNDPFERGSVGLEERGEGLSR
jgi:hypothetical protein